MRVDGPREVHHMSRVTIPDRGQDQHPVGDDAARAVGDSLGTNDIHVERQVVAVLLDAAAGDDTNLAHLDGVVDLGPGQFFVAILGTSAAHGRSLSYCWVW